MRWLNNAKFQPFEDMLFDLLAVRIGDFKLLNINGLSCFQHNFMH